MKEMIMKSTSIKRTLAGLIGSAAIVGCAAQTPYMDQRFGEAVNAAKAQQTLNPDASLNMEPVVGMGGPAASAVIIRYNESYKTPPASTDVFTIGVSGGGGGGGMK
jgi:hypothetical protein